MKRKPDPVSDSAATRSDELRVQAEAIARRRRDAVPDDLDTLSPAEARRVLHDLQVHQIELELQNEELRQSQAALEALRARYFDLYDLAPVGYFTLDETGLIVEANLTCATLLGVPRGALIKRLLSGFLMRDDAAIYYRHRKQLFETRQPQAFELRMLKSGGVPFTAWIEAAVASDDDGVLSCRLVVSDITERKAIAENLRSSRRLLKTAGKVAQMGGWKLKLPHNELLWSDEICAILEFPNGSMPSLADVRSMYTPASCEVISAVLARCARDGTPFDCELGIFTANRRRIDVRVIGQAVRDEAGAIVGLEGAFQDITARKVAEQTRESLKAQLRESQKMESIGTLAGGIAHDFNNILGTILGNVELARQDIGTNLHVLVSLEEIHKAGHRARDLVQQILAFSRRQPTLRRVMPLASMVEESARLLRAALPAILRVEVSCAADTPHVLADASQLTQVLLNLGSNAAHAMQGRSGTIDIRCEGITLDESSAGVDLNLRPGLHARIVVSDTGHGMDAATRRRVFEPFFTTKPVGTGTGLGLSVVHGIMQAHEGAIVVHSEVGKGSRFELYFPLARGVPEPASPDGATVQAGDGRGGHVVYIDDDEAQVFLARRMLERWGYRVSAHLNQREALDLLLAGEHRVDLVVTDFNMPGMSGLDVAREIRDALPALPVVMVSGYITDTLRAQAAEVGVRELVEKTHAVESLRAAVRRVLPDPVPGAADRGTS